MSEPTKIAIMGAESTGKTTLAHGLAASLNGVVVTEALRDWVSQKQRTPRADEQQAIFDAQLERERLAMQRARAQGARVLICDTTPLTIAINSVYYFNDDRLIAAGVAHHRSYAVTLLTRTDLLWEADGLQRDGPEVQHATDALQRKTLREHNIAAIDVHGTGDARLAHALAAVQWLIES